MKELLTAMMAAQTSNWFRPDNAIEKQPGRKHAIKTKKKKRKAQKQARRKNR